MIGRKGLQCLKLMVESPQINQYQKSTDMYEWLEQTFETVTNFKHEARESVESFATETAENDSQPKSTIELG